LAETHNAFGVSKVVAFWFFGVVHSAFDFRRRSSAGKLLTFAGVALAGKLLLYASGVPFAYLVERNFFWTNDPKQSRGAFSRGSFGAAGLPWGWGSPASGG